MAFDKDKPAASTSLRNSNPQILANWSALEAALNREHEFSTGGTVADQAHHKRGSARAFFQDAEPTTRVDGTTFTSEDLGSLWFDSNSSPDNQFKVLTATTPTWTPVSTEIIAVLVAQINTWAAVQTFSEIPVFTKGLYANNSFLAARNAADNGNVDLIKADTNDVAVVPDGTETATNAAPSSDKDLVNKKYVDDRGIHQVVNTQSGAVNTGTTRVPYDDTIPQITEGDEYMTLAITPKSATNKLLIEVVCVLANSDTGAHEVLTAALFQDATANAIAGISNHISFVNEPIILNFKHFMVAGTTSETTFRLRAGSHNASKTTTFNGQSAARRLGGITMSSITITEIKV